MPKTPDKKLEEAENCLVLAQQLEDSRLFDSSLSMLQQAMDHLELVKSTKEKLYAFTAVANNLSWLAAAMSEKGSLGDAEYIIASMLSTIVSELDAHGFSFERDQDLCKCFVDCLSDCSVFFLSVDEYSQGLDAAERGLKFLEKCHFLAGTTSFGRCVHCRAYALASLGQSEQAKQEYVRALRVYVSACDWSKNGERDEVVSALTKHVRTLESDGGKKNQNPGKLRSPLRTKKK